MTAVSSTAGYICAGGYWHPSGFICTGHYPPAPAHEHDYEQIRASDGSYLSDVFCRRCGETLKLARPKHREA